MEPNESMMPSLLDREISSAADDAFGHRHYAKALRSIVEAPTNVPPFSVGLLGGWGTGKSSIKELYLSSLNEERTKNGDGRIRSDRYHTIIFNAWRHGGGDIKRALLRHVFLTLGGDEERLKRELFSNIQRTFKEKRAFGEFALDFFAKRILPVLWLVGLALAIAWLTRDAVGWLGIQVDDQTKLITIGLMVLTFVAKDMLGIKFEPLTRRRIVNHVELPRATSEQFEDLLLEQLREYKGGRVPGKKGEYCERVVVFVDDLDRLSAEEMVSGLDAIRTFMEIPRGQLPAGLGIVFVISCDEEKVAHALANGRRRPGGSELPASVFNRADGRRFLDRIFQFRLEIPHFPKRDMRQFVLAKLRSLGNVSENLQHRNISEETLIDRMIHVGVESPRNAIQILNAFVQSWWLATQRELDGVGNDRPGGLHEGAVTNHPIALGVLCAFRVDFPEFFADLQDEPDLIARFTDVVIRGNSLDEQPETTREILEKYLETATSTGGQSELRREYRPLRQFVASLKGVRWPPSLQPLLILTEDPITRKYGARAPRLFDAFVSGDLDGVLEVLGRNHDSKPLQTEDVQMLRDMAEELSHESEARRVNASTVLAGLTNRLPIDQARILVAPLARELGQSPELRWRVGLEKISEVLEIAESDDQVDVASRLVQDILRPDSPLDFRLESGESPSLDEAVEMARRTCELALRVRKAHWLNSSAEKQLFDWLESRRVSVTSGHEHEVSFNDLETWVKAHEEIVPGLGSRYSNLVITQLEAEEVDGLDEKLALERCKAVFESLHEAGEESRPELWEQITRLVGVRSEESVALARDFMVSHPTASTAPMSKFIAAFANRLSREMRDSTAWKLDWKAGGESLLNLLERSLGELDTNAVVAITDLTIVWSEVKDTASFAIRSLTLLAGRDESAATKIIANWISHLTTDLPDSCVFELADRYAGQLTDLQRASLNTTLQAVTEPEQVGEKPAAAYQGFMRRLPIEALNKTPMPDHVRSLFTRVGERYQNPSKYLERVFPVVPRIIEGSPPDAAGQMLHNLFSRAKGVPAVFGWLHSHMTRHWPIAEPQFGPYNPVQIFDDAYNFATASPDAHLTWAIVTSLEDMVTREIVPAAKSTQLAGVACAIWPQHPDRVAPTIKSLATTLSHAQIANLMDSVDVTDDTQRAHLGDVWKEVAAIRSGDDRRQVTTMILQKTQKGTDGDPDFCLGMWIEAVGDGRHELLETGIMQDGLNDSQRHRIWVRIDRIAATLEPEFFKRLLPRVFRLSDVETTVAAVFESTTIINSLFATKQLKFELSDVLLRAFPEAVTNTAKVGIARWIKELDSQAVLRRLGSVEGMTQADLELLAGQFPKIKSVKKALRTKMAQSGS